MLNRLGKYIDLLVVTHIDDDHIGGILELLKKMNPIWNENYKDKNNYDIAEAGSRNKSARQLLMEGIKGRETLSENEFALLVILSQEAFDKEWIADIENAVRQFPY